MLFSALRTSLLLFFSTLLCWQSAPAAVDAANLLLISPSLSKSLLMHMGKLADILVGAGHNVTVWIPEMQPLAENGTKLAQQVIRTRGLINVVDCIVGLDAFAEEIGDYGARLVEDQAMASYCEALLERGTELERLRAAHFDLAFSNMIDLCFHGIVHQLGIPRHIWVSTGPIPDAFHWFLGVPQPPSIVPTLQETLPLGPRMTAWERAQNMWQMALSWYSLGILFRRENALFRERFSPDFPPLEHLAVHHTDLAFVNVDEFLEPALPTLRKVIPTGGLGLMEPRRHLSPEFAKIAQSGPKGAVLFSLGSMTDTRLLDAKKWANLLRAFAHFADYAFIVKTSPDDWIARNFSAQNEARNVHLFEWLPQIELLAHPNVRLLIGHAGYNSLLEASALGVPVLLIPLFFDQLRNAKCAEYRGHARVLSKSDLLVEEKLVAEIGEMLENQSYKQKAQRLAKLFREKPNRPEQAVIEWTQFVLSNGPLEEMVPESAGMSLVQFHCLDILLYAGVLIAILGWLLYKTIRISIGWWRRGGEGEKKRKRD